MKKILVIVLAVILTVTLSLTSVTFAAGGRKEVTLAQEAGQAWLERMVALTGEPLEWLGAHLTTPQVCYGLDGRPSAYMFAMENNGQVVGYIVVGSSAYGYPMFEAADVPPPSIPSTDEGKSILERDLGLKVEKIGTPTRLLYLGFDNLFAVYQAGQQEVAVNLKFDFAIPASNLTAAMPSPEIYKANKEATEQSNPEVLAGSTSTVQSAPYRWGLLTMTAYQGQSGCCGPCSGVSIGRYYREVKGYSNLPVDYPGCSQDDSCYDNMYNELFEHMGTGVTCFTTPTQYGPGFVGMTQDHGYSNFSHVYASYYKVQPGYYWTIAGYIDNGWPTALKATVFYEDIYGVPGWPVNWHFVAIRGYFPPDPYGYNPYYAIECTDSATGYPEGTDNLYLNWNNLGWGFSFVTIKN